LGSQQLSIHIKTLLDDLKSSKHYCPRNLFSGSNSSPEKSLQKNLSIFCLENLSPATGVNRGKCGNIISKDQEFGTTNYVRLVSGTSSPERERAENGGADDQWVLKRRELPGFAIVNAKKRPHPWDAHFQFSMKTLLSKRRSVPSAGICIFSPKTATIDTPGYLRLGPK